MPDSQKPFLKVDNYEKMGEVITKWSTGKLPRPSTISELITILNAHGISIVEMPDGWSAADGVPTINIVPLADGVLNITLPSVEMLRRAQASIAAETGEYSFPDEYNDAYLGDPKPTLDPDVRERIRKARLADYCISICM